MAVSREPVTGQVELDSDQVSKCTYVNLRLLGKVQCDV